MDQPRGDGDRWRPADPAANLRLQPAPADLSRFQARAEPAVLTYLTEHHITHTRERVESTSAQGDPAPRGSRESLVRPRLEHPRQQDSFEHRGRRLRVPQHVRRAVGGSRVLPGRARGAAVPRPGRVRPVLGLQRNIVQHMPALPHREVAAALAAVRASRKPPVDTLAFEFLLLTAARSGEVRFAT